MPKRKRASAASPRLVRVVSIDIGSTGTRVCYRISGHGERIFRVDFGHGVNEERLNSPTKMTYVRTNPEDIYEFLCGHQLEQLYREGQVSDANIIHNMKLGFYEHVETKRFKSELGQQLASFGKTRQDLLDDYVAFLIRSATAAMTSSYNFTTNELDGMDLVVLMTMPDMIDPLANKPLCAAAKKAGATEAYIAHESVCLTTSLFDDELQNVFEGNEKMFTVGEGIAVADFGGAYACMTIQDVLPHVEGQRTPGLKTVHSSISRPCGSKMIDEGFQDMLPHLEEIAQDKEFSTVASLARALGHPEADFVALATDSFIQRTKIPFRDSASIQTYRTEVTKATGPNWEIKYWEASLSRETVRKLFDRVIDTALEILKSCLGMNHRSHRTDNRPKKLIVAGGFARSDYVRTKIRDAMKDEGVTVWFGLADRNDAVCRGALLRYKNPSFEGYNKRFNLAVPRDEELDEEHHSDALLGTDTTQDGDDEITSKRWNRKLVSEGDYDEETTWALERLNWIVRENDAEGLKEYESWAVDYPELKGPYRYESRLVYSEDSAKLRDHEPLYKADGKTLQNHLKMFDVAPLVIQHPEKEGWETTTHASGKKTYQIAICTKVFVSDAGWDIRRIIGRVDDVPDDEELESRQATQANWSEGDKRKIHDPKFSSVALGTS